MILGQGLRWHAQSGVESEDPAIKQMMLESILEILSHSESVFRPCRSDSTEVHKYLLVWDGKRE